MGRSVSVPYQATLVTYEHWQHEEPEELWHWQEYKEDLQARIVELWPSMVTADEWIGDEDCVICENVNTQIGVSEYCGLVSIWAVPKEDAHGDYAMETIHKGWCKAIADKFETLGTLRRVATMSNGEALFERKQQTT